MTKPFSDCFITPFFKVQKSQQLYGTQPYYRVVCPDGVILAVLYREDRFVLVKQFRPNLDAYTLEFPAGGIDLGESPLEAANRELWEEVGISARLLELGTARLQMNRVAHKEHLFFGIERPNSATSFDEWRQEPGLTSIRLDRRDFFKRNTESTFFEQLAALGLLQKASLIFELDLVTAKFVDIEDRLANLL